MVRRDGPQKPPVQAVLYAGCRLNSPQPWSRMALFNPAFGLTRLPCCSLLPGHIPGLQILSANERVVLADRRSGLVQEVFTGVGYLAMNLLNLGFFLFPVAEFDFAGHAPREAAQALLVFFEAVQRGNKAAIAQRGATGNPHVDANSSGHRRNRLEHFTRSLDAGVPPATRLADGDVLGHTQNVPAVAIPHPAQLGQLDAAVDLINFKLLGVRGNSKRVCVITYASTTTSASSSDGKGSARWNRRRNTACPAAP